jgi:hypothetical protein
MRNARHPIWARPIHYDEQERPHLCALSAAQKVRGVRCRQTPQLRRTLLARLAVNDPLLSEKRVISIAQERQIA